MAIKKKIGARQTETLLTTAAEAVGKALGKLARRVGVVAAAPIIMKNVKRKPVSKNVTAKKAPTKTKAQ